MKFKPYDDDGGAPFYDVEWGDGLSLMLEGVRQERDRFRVVASVHDDYDTLYLAPTVMDARDARSRRAVASAILHDANWPARIEEACGKLLAYVESKAIKSIQLIDVADVDNLPDLECTIEGILQVPGLAALIGNYGTMKTFGALDMAACIATGRLWHGHAVKQGPVVYIYSEGIAGLKRRKAAWEEWNRTTIRNMRFVPHAVPLMDANAVETLLDAIYTGPQPVLVVIDTYARAISASGGNENATEDAGIMIAAADRIKRETGATVLFIHHTNRAGEFRGNTAFMAGLDNAILIEREGAAITLTCEKSKDMEPFEPIQLVAVPVAGSLALAKETYEMRIERMQNSLTPAAMDLLEALETSPEGMRYGEWVTASGRSKGRNFSEPHNELQAAKLVENHLGKWVSIRRNRPVVPQVPNGSGTAGTNGSSSSTPPLGGGTGTTFEPLDPVSRGNGSNSLSCPEPGCIRGVTEDHPCPIHHVIYAEALEANR